MLKQKCVKSQKDRYTKCRYKSVKGEKVLQEETETQNMKIKSVQNKICQTLNDNVLKDVKNRNKHTEGGRQSVGFEVVRGSI